MSRNIGISKKILKILGKKSTIPIDTLYSDEPKINYSIARAVKNLADAGLLEVHKSINKDFIRITPLGKNKLNCMKLEADDALISRSWDGFWRIVMLDIPEERKSEREALRYLLKKAGFVCMKNSVWISMYPYENLFENIKKDLGLQKELMIVVADKIDEETEKEFLSIFTSNKNR